VKGFFEVGSCKLLAQIGFRDPPDLCLLSSYDYRCESLVPSYSAHFVDEDVEGRRNKLLMQNCKLLKDLSLEIIRSISATYDS
jgi:hypothetical protein